MEVLKILDAGLLTTVQDLGRYGYQRYGVSASGVMDEFSAKVANILAGNDIKEAVLETTLKGVSIEFLADCVFAVTGAECETVLNDKKINLWKSYKAVKGDILKMGICKAGLRNYIAFAGGIDVPVVMNSRSTNLKAKIGGFNGRKLAKGDILFVNKNDFVPLMSFEKKYIPTYTKEIQVGVILGQQEDHFTEKGINTFFNEIYNVTQESDRMGIRLTSVSGNTIEHKSGADIISDGITFGAIQIPGSGQPIVMMADRQTTGGYTKIGNVISSDLTKLAQAVPGTKVKFVKYELPQAIDALYKMNYIINNEASYTDRENREYNYSLNINGKEYELQLEMLD